MKEHWTLKDLRKLLPHRSTSVIQDWVAKGILSCERAPGAGNAHQFTLYDMVHACVADQLSALNVFNKPYAGRNSVWGPEDEGNVIEIFDYDPSKKGGASNPLTRSPENATKFYETYNFNVYLIVDILRVKPPVLWPGKPDGFPPESNNTACRTPSRRKVGALYYVVTFVPDSAGTDQDNLLTDLQGWRVGNTVGRGATLCLISVRLLKEHVNRVLGIRV